MGRKSVLNRGKSALATLLLFCLAFFAAPAMAGTDPPVMVEPGISQEMVEGSARYLVTEPGREIGVEAAVAAYKAGQFEFEFPPDESGTIRDWRVWMALPFESASTDRTEPMRKVLGIGGIFAELPRVYLTCEGEKPREILASQSVEGGALSARYFTYVRTQSFALAPREKCLAMLNLATSDNPNLGIFREGELGTRQVIAVLLKGAVTATLLIIGLILAITSYVTARPLGIYLGAAYSLAMLQNETTLFASLLAGSSAAGREIWESVTILTVFAMVSTFLFGFRDDLRLKAWGKRLLAAIVITTPAIIIARASDDTPSLVWTLYVSMFLAALTVVFRLDIGRWLRIVAGAILFAGTIGVIWTEPYLGGRHLTDLTIEWFRDFFRIVSGLGVLVLMLVDIVGSRRERDLMVIERIDSLETQAETDRRLLETEREYARARDAANRTKAQLAAASHDIRQPIVGLRAAVASEAERLSPGLQSRLGEAIDYLEHLTHEYSNQPSTSLAAEAKQQSEPYSVDLITSAVGNMFEGEARQAGIKLTVSGCDCQTRVPALALIRATSNLVANALRHAEPSAVEITATSDDGHCQIRVVDDGKGMDAVTLAKVQHSGVKSEDSDGDGLGLAIIHDLASRHGFAFALSSNPGSGTEAVISITREGDVRLSVLD
ncbi:MAG: HAMP domain-containing sensor histidine kinase [Pseudomonadota bacterium]